MEKDIILVTGQSGMKIANCLEKIFDHDQIFNIEDEMIEVYREDQQEVVQGDDKEIMWEILSRPFAIQRRWWDQAFARIMGKITRSRREGNQLFVVSFHASFYHQRRREFVSPVDFQQLGTLRKRIRMVVTLIDDCYDIYRRLLAPGEMFAGVLDSKVTPEMAMFSSIWNLLLILTWREVEIAFSRKIVDSIEENGTSAKQKVPFFVIAVKHPAFMIRNLMTENFDKLKILYLAHPISAIRKETFSRTTHFPSELNEFASELLAKVSGLILFIPDTIDEYRFRKDDQGNFLPGLSDPWLLPYEEKDWLFVPPSAQQKTIDALNPKQCNYSRDEQLLRAASMGVAVLAHKLNQQLTSRDLSLVDQSRDGIIAFKPYWGGYPPQGVLEEANYNAQLMLYPGNERRELYILDTQQNTGMFKLENFLSNLIRVLREDHITPAETATLKNAIVQWRVDQEKVSIFGQGLKKSSVILSEIVNLLPPNYEFKDDFVPSKKVPVSGDDPYELKKRRKIGWDKLIEQTRSEKLLGQYCRDPHKSMILLQEDNLSQGVSRLIRATKRT